jgi:hypothetical protein
MHTIIFHRRLLCLPVLLGLSACTIMVKPINDINISGLRTIQQAYQQTVHAAHKDSGLSWNNGRLGNMIVNINGGANKGLCYHWQRLVYTGIQPALVKTGWKATGIAINEGSFFEHHAVLVYNPATIKLTEILNNVNKSNSYVLDPWSSGEPRVYTTADWLKLPVTIKKAARLTRINTSDTKSTRL